MDGLLTKYPEGFIKGIKLQMSNLKMFILASIYILINSHKLSDLTVLNMDTFTPRSLI